MTIAKGWNAIRQGGGWYHEEYGNDGIDQYNWGVVDDTTMDDGELPPVWLPFNMMPDWLRSDYDPITSGVVCLELYDTSGVCCNEYRWETILQLDNDIYGGCKNEDCPVDNGGMYHRISTMDATNPIEWACSVESLTMKSDK